MDKYIKICMRCINTCKQRADLGITMIKCPAFELNTSTSRNSKASSHQGAGDAIKTKGK